MIEFEFDYIGVMCRSCGQEWDEEVDDFDESCQFCGSTDVQIVEVYE